MQLLRTALIRLHASGQLRARPNANERLSCGPSPPALVPGARQSELNPRELHQSPLHLPAVRVQV